MQIKVVQHQISYKKVTRCTCLSSPGVKLWCLKNWYVSNIILNWNRKVDSILGWMLCKLTIISKNCLNKNGLELNFVKKVSGWTCLSPTGVELEGSKDWYVSNIILHRSAQK